MNTRLKLIMFMVLLSTVVTSCCYIFSKGTRKQKSYIWKVEVAGEQRRAKIWTSNESCESSPAVIYLHGRGGDIPDSEIRRQFHINYPQYYIIYAEGTNFDNRSDGKKGWETRFPYIHDHCGQTKDYEYIKLLIDHLHSIEDIDRERIAICGHSSGGFFTLSLSQLMSNHFIGFASLGSYTSFNPDMDEINCMSTYQDGIPRDDITDVNNLNDELALFPTNVYYIIGSDESVVRPNQLMFNDDCEAFSYVNNSVTQLCKKNGCAPPECPDYLSIRDLQIFEAIEPLGRNTHFRIYDGSHSWPSEANNWVMHYFTFLFSQQ